MLSYVGVAIFLVMAAFKPTGYQISLTIEQGKYSDINRIEVLLEHQGFNVVKYRHNGTGEMVEWKERKAYPGRYPGEVYTALVKRIDDKKYSWVEIYIYYVKESENKLSHILIEIGNIYMGLTVPEIKGQIDRFKELIYSELVKTVEKDKVVVQKKEVVSPVGRVGW